ncbi:hypothetical protein C121_66 [Stenotrophomonas phage C121]|uniref:phosphofructokinase n=1 Tax=Stenotrophomonas phage C121 TaxID=2914029 RepID=UPI00232976B4|nr:phosphofructokinase [Stenotrophomonas phage C121]UKL14799.1 hypothetical protein C121_66 [Stenotrophomonas phage C121]
MKSSDVLIQGTTESNEDFFDRRKLCIELLKTWKPVNEKPSSCIHASEFIKEAADTLGNRAAERDVQEERSMKKVVNVFNALHGTNLTEAQGWSFMSCLKMGRAVSGKFRKDDYVDMAAYAALEGECRSKENHEDHQP